MPRRRSRWRSSISPGSSAAIRRVPGCCCTSAGTTAAGTRSRPTPRRPRPRPTADAVAHYAASDGLSSTQILALVREHAAAFADVVEPLPASLRVRERLPDRPAALRAAHFPRSGKDLDAARRRLAFEELLLAQLTLLRRRARRREAALAPLLDGPRALTERWLAEPAPVRAHRRSGAGAGGGRR